jgi:hypothetical protein
MTTRNIFGYTLVVVSFVVWGAIPAVAFFDISFNEAAVVATTMLVSSYVMFYVGVFLLGRQAWDKAKALWRAILRR